MVQMADNRAFLQGRVRRVEPTGALAGHSSVNILVDSTSDVQGFPNLIGDVRGKEIAVSVPADMMQDLGPKDGAQLSITARVGGSRIFAVPDQ